MRVRKGSSGEIEYSLGPHSDTPSRIVPTVELAESVIVSTSKLIDSVIFVLKVGILISLRTVDSHASWISNVKDAVELI